MDKLLDIIRAIIPSFENLPAISLNPGSGPGWLFGAFGTVFVSLYGLSIGRTRAVLSLLSVYVAFVIIKLFPYLDKVTQTTFLPFEDYWLKIGLFILFYAAIFLVFNFSFLKKRMASTEFSLLGILLISIFQFGFLISIVFSLIPKETALNWSLGFYQYFGTQLALFVWAIAPLPVLMFIKRK